MLSLLCRSAFFSLSPDFVHDGRSENKAKEDTTALSSGRPSGYRAVDKVTNTPHMKVSVCKQLIRDDSQLVDHGQDPDNT